MKSFFEILSEKFMSEADLDPSAGEYDVPAALKHLIRVTENRYGTREAPEQFVKLMDGLSLDHDGTPMGDFFLRVASESRRILGKSSS